MEIAHTLKWIGWMQWLLFIDTYIVLVKCFVYLFDGI
jgi:hypothetical protein